MKKNFIAFVAVVIAISASAFTAPAKSAFSMYVFEYQPPTLNDFTQISVENTENWVYVGQDQSLCSNTNVRACRIEVTSNFVDDPASPSALSGLALTTTVNSGIAYVSGISSPSFNHFSNKP